VELSSKWPSPQKMRENVSCRKEEDGLLLLSCLVMGLFWPTKTRKMNISGTASFFLHLGTLKRFFLQIILLKTFKFKEMG
jgi:hypothetical protein